ncbi:lipoprotein, rare lipoprotein A family lipoprotein [Alcanivorax hongdengensis A-11-3]|uniref:Endolytic peptidoglycan transglycosylase RlpA n=1 Tax=Alcanivorax hongdengensis A-11-3 TaxID=1177179 RepID=L0WIW8_9GAMM|nr:septal ring lytic transglycosylase RlpA family protein [Alcanivorax hongdengensis]EKF75790.1 lipoprotein, rare lipoprotein A family lipoprotein [Alcanivorax hongdengensis A-11-3]
MRLWLALSLTLLVSACATTTPVTTPDSGQSPSQAGNGAPGSDRYAHDQDTAPMERRDVASLPEPTPKQEAPSRYGNPKTYSVWGKTYHVLPSAKGYVAEGTASWYGQKFHGYRTSSGEPFDMYRFTAAHRTLPLPTYARVTNLDNGKSLVVRINDRGPFHDDRLIDLSWAAAVRLGIEQHGTGHVRVEALSGTDSPAEQPSSTVPTAVRAAVDSPPPSSTLFLQAGAFQTQAAAQRMQMKLRTELGVASQIRNNEQGLFLVWLGPYRNDSERQQARTRVSQAGFDSPMPVSP